MTFFILQFLISAIIIIIAGYFLTKSADKIADLTGWGKMFVGSLLLASATSFPELMVDIKSVQMNLPDLAVGDLLGSSLFNLLILATLDFTFPSAFKRTAFSPAFLPHSISAVLTIMLTAIVGIAISSKIETSFLGVSIFSWTIVIIYFFGIRLTYLDGNKTSVQSQEHQNSILNKKNKLFYAVSSYLGASLAIIVAAPFLVSSADQIATSSGLGHTFIGSTLVALSTSLPELVATIAAFRIGSPDLALGNIFGSNAFNMILFVPLDYFYVNNLFASVQNIHIVTAFGVVMATGMAVMGQLYRKKERSRFLEPSSEAVVVIIIIIFLILYQLK